MDYKAMGRRVRLLRKRRGWTQERLAAETGISLSFLGHIERGSRVASLETVLLLSRALDSSVDALLGLRPLPSEDAPLPILESPRDRLAALLTEAQRLLAEL